MNIILMSTVLNANGISGKAANKVHCYLYFNDTSEFVLISPVFHKSGLINAKTRCSCSAKSQMSCKKFKCVLQ